LGDVKDVDMVPWLFKRVEQIFQTEGLISVVRHGFAFVTGRCFQYKTFYIIEYDLLKQRREADFLPGIQKFSLNIISTSEEADELEASGFEFRSHIINIKERLDKGAIAFCIFIGSELVYIAWVAMTQQAKNILDAFPVNVDFSANEAYWGGIWTSPRYRGMGLATYGAFKRMQFMSERGKVVVRGAVAKDNVASLAVGDKHGPKRRAEARYLKILWWEWWKEKPFTVPSGE